MKFETTERGFSYVQFEDRYGASCTLQKSSLDFESAIWFGVDDANLQTLDPEKGWVPFPVPEDVLQSTRMHLTRKQVAELLPILIRFIETGEIQESTPEK